MTHNGSAPALRGGATIARWIEHFVIPGERLAEIASRYAVDVANIIEWNSLDSDKPMLRVGQRLRVLSRSSAAPRKRERYKVKAGDNWAKIARRFDVDVNKLQKQWNPELGPDLQAGDHVIVWIERENVAADVERDPEPPTTMQAKLAAVVEPTHGANANLAATLASVVEAKSASSQSASKPQSAVPQSNGKPVPAAIVSKTALSALPSTGSKQQPASVAPAATFKPASTKPAPVQPASAKPAPAPAASVKPAPAPSSDMQARLAAIVDARSAPRAPSGKDTKLAMNTSSSTVATKPGAVVLPTVVLSTPRPAVPAGKDSYQVVPVPAGACSVGTPTRGRLRNGVQLPENPNLYTVRNPDHSWGTTLAVQSIQRALQIFRQQSGFTREIHVCDMSLHKGGRFRPHRSHTSGRDVDIRLPLRAGVPPETVPENPDVVDWDAAWQLVRAVMDTGQVHYIFLARSRQVPLYKAALRAGETAESLATLMQYPAHTKNTVLRHSAGHTKHIHVRWKCAPDESQCVDP